MEAAYITKLPLFYRFLANFSLLLTTCGASVAAIRLSSAIQIANTTLAPLEAVVISCASQMIILWR
jgi:hypothetical protein